MPYSKIDIAMQEMRGRADTMTALEWTEVLDCGRSTVDRAAERLGESTMQAPMGSPVPSMADEEKAFAMMRIAATMPMLPRIGLYAVNAVS